MAIMPICTFPDSVLSQVSQPVDKVETAIRQLAGSMVETMYDAPGVGVGLAAIQVGQPLRLVVMDTNPEESRGNPLILVNPRIVEAKGEIVHNEGCLSVPGYSADVKRAAEVVCLAQDLDGNQMEIKAEGLTAVCLQHELDHLEGVLFLDRLSSLKRALIKKRILKQIRREGR